MANNVDVTGDGTLETIVAELRQSPSTMEAWDRLEDYAAQNQSPDEVGAVFREMLQGQLPAEVASEVGSRALQFHEEWFGEDSPQLLVVMSRVMEIDPDAAEGAFQRLTMAFTQSERWDELLELYDRAIQTAESDARREQLLEEAVQSAKDFAGQPARAIKYLDQLLALRPDDNQIASQLERLLERQERWQDLIAFWRNRLGGLAAKEARKTRMRIATLFVDQLEQPSEAITEVRGILEDPGAVADEATTLLERIVELEDAPVQARRDALSMLKTRYDEEGRAKDVVSTLEKALTLAEPQEAVALHREAAQRLAAAGEQAAAMDHWASLLQLDPTAGDAREQLRVLADETGAYARLVEALEAASEEAAASQRISLRVEAADVRRVALEDTAGAIALYAGVLEEEDIDSEVALSVARRLAELYEAAERGEDRLAMLERLAQLEPEAAQRRAVLGDAARLADRLGQPDRALRIWEGRLEGDPADAEALDAMVDVLEREERWEPLVEALRRRVAGAGEGVPAWQRRSDLVRIANIQGGPLEAPADAIRTWREVAESFGEDPETVDALHDLYTRTEAWDDLASLLERTTEREAAHLATVRSRLGDTYRDRLGDVRRAIAAYRRTLESDPRHEGAREGLTALAHDEEVGGEAVDALATCYRLLDDWEAMLGLLEQRLAHAPDDRVRLELLREAARTQERRAGDPEAALGSTARAFVLEPTSVMLENELLRLAEATGRWQDAAEALRSGAAALGDTEEERLRAAHLRASEATVHEQQLEQPAEALAAHVAALSLEPARVGSAEALVRLGESTGQWDTVEEALSRAAQSQAVTEKHLRLLAQVQRREPGQKLYETLMRLAAFVDADLDPRYEAASLAVETLGDAEAATESTEKLYEEASRLLRLGLSAKGERTPSEVTSWAVEQLMELYEKAGKHDRIVELLVQAAALSDEETSRAWRRRAAQIAHEQLGDRSRAIELLRDILSETPDDAEASDVLAQLYEAEQRWAEMLQLRRYELSKQSDPARKLALRLEVARLFDELEKQGGRIDMLRANLDEQAGHDESIEVLQTLLTRQSRFAELADLLTEQAQRLEENGEASRAADLWGRVASLAEQQLHDTDRALDAHRRVASLAPTTEALDALARIHTEREEPAQAARWLERRVQMAEDDERTTLALKLARSLFAAGKGERAAEVLEEGRAHDPASAEIRDLLATRYRETEAWEPLARLLADATEHVSDDDKVLEMVREAAELYDQLGTPENAVGVLKRGVDLAPDDRRLKLMYADGLLAAGHLDEAKAVLEGVIEEFGRRRNAERADVHHRLAKVARAQGEIEAAIEELEKASKMDMGNAPMLRLLGELSREAGDLDRAERAYRALLLVARRAGDKDIGVGAAEVLWELHDIAKKRDEEDQAQELLESAFETAAQSDLEASRLKDALVERGDAGRALEALERRLDAVDENESRAALLAEVANVLEGLEREQDAFAKRLEAIKLDPASADLQDATRELARKLGKVEDYADAMQDVLEKRRREEDAPVAAELLMRLGELNERDLGELDEAAKLYRRVENTGHRIADAWRALARVAGARGDASEQQRVLAQIVESDAVPEEDRTDALYRLAGVQLGVEDYRKEGIETLRSALARDPQYDRAGAMLRAAVQAAPDDGTLFALYEEVARGSGDDRLMLDFLSRKVSQPGATMRDVREAVERADACEDPDSAEQLLERGVEIATEQQNVPEARWAMEQLAERRRAAGDTARALQWMQQAAATAEGEEGFELTLQVAQMATEEGHLQVAAEAYESLLEQEPNDQRVWQPLLAVYRQLGDEDKLNDLAASTLDALLEPSARNLVRMERALCLMADEERTPDAVDVLREILDEEPDHQEAGRMLAELYERAGYDEDLVDLLNRQLDVAIDNQDAENIADVSLRLGQLLEQVRRDDAIDVYRRALEFVPEERRVIERLLALLGEDDDPRFKIEIMEKLLGVETGQKAADLSRQLYQQWSELGDESGMQRALELGYRGCPEDDELRESLRSWYGSRDDWDGLAKLHAAEAERKKDDSPEEAVTELRWAAAIYGDKLGDTGRAVAMLRDARAANPADIELLRELVDQLVASGDPMAALEDVGASLETHEEMDETRVELLRMRAKIRREVGQEAEAVQDLEEAYAAVGGEAAADLAAALDALRQRQAADGDAEGERATTFRQVEVLQAAGEGQQARDVLAEWVSKTPDDREALLKLKDVDLASENWEGVVETAQRLVQFEEGEAQVDAVMLLADACEAAGRPEDARPGLEQAYQAQPDNEKVVERLRSLYETIGAHAELAHMLLADAENADDEQKFELLRHAGRLLVEAGDPESGLAALETATQIRPDDHETVLYLADAYTASERYGEAGQLLERAIDNHPKRRSPELAELQHRMANLARAVGDRQLEMQWLNAALDADKNNGYVASELAHLAMELGEHDVALNALRAVTLMKGEAPMSRAMAFLLQARIAHQRGESRRALLWGRKAKSEDPELTEADEFLQMLGDQ